MIHDRVRVPLLRVGFASYGLGMRSRTLVGLALVVGFVGVVVEAAANNQCPASALGACARIHLEMMRPRSGAPTQLVAVPMRGDARHG